MKIESSTVVASIVRVVVVVAWPSGNAFCLINEVTLSRAGLVLACRHINHLGM